MQALQQAHDRRELYKTAIINSPHSKVFEEGEVVSVRVRHRMMGGWVFTCSTPDGRVDSIAEGFLKSFCF